MWLIILIVLLIVVGVIYSDASKTNADKARKERWEEEKRQAESWQKEYSKKMRTHPLVVPMINDIDEYINSIIPSVQKGLPYRLLLEFFSDHVRVSVMFTGEGHYGEHGIINCEYSTYGFMVRDNNEHIGLSMAVVDELNFRKDLHITISKELGTKGYNDRLEIDYIGDLSNYLPPKKDLKPLV